MVAGGSYNAAGALGDSRRPHELPPGAEEFFGRDGELKQLIQRLRSRKNTAVVGPAGLGKTALAAKALVAVVGDSANSLAASPFPDGIVFLNLYTLGGLSDRIWDTLANKIAGPAFMERSQARERAGAACNARDLLIILEGGEEASGRNGRAGINEILSVLSPQNRWLLLTRLTTQATATETVELGDALHPEDASRLFDSITRGQLSAETRTQALRLLQGHPLALTWAGNLLARHDDDPQLLLDDWARGQLPALNDPVHAEHTLEWLFERSIRGLDQTAHGVLAAAGLLANSPFSLGAIDAAMCNLQGYGQQEVRQALKNLVQRSLLRRGKEAASWQFTHVLGYQFARKEIGSDPGIRTGLGRWLSARLAADGAVGNLQSIADVLEHLSAVVRTDGDQQLWEPLVQPALYQFTDRLNDLGGLNQAKLLLLAVAQWMRRLGPDKVGESYWLREQSVLSDRHGDVLMAQGDLGGALAAYREALQVSRRLAEADPSNAGWQRDLSISHNKVGDVLMAQGDLGGALAAYREALPVRRRLAEADPSNAGWQRDLSVSQERVGDVLMAQGDLGGALAAYREALPVRRRLVEADPSNAGWQRDLSYSLTRMAQLQERLGHRDNAIQHAKESLGIDERLAKLDPSNATWQKDLVVSRNLVMRLEKSAPTPAG